MNRIVRNLVNGKWKTTENFIKIPNPLNKNETHSVSNTSFSELNEFVNKTFDKRCNRYGLHNPLYNRKRYLEMGNISFNMANKLSNPSIIDKYVEYIRYVVPKAYDQARGEVTITANFFKNFAGDNVRNILARGFTTVGDHDNQDIYNYRFPYGEVAVICPFNFPLEIPALQLMGALFMGNKPTLHCDPKVALVMEEFLQDLIECGLDPNDVNFLNGEPDVINKFLIQNRPELTVFTGSSEVANKLTKDLNGKIKIEDAGFNWKIVGRADQFDVDEKMQIINTAMKDMFDNSGQKCSAQSLMFMHESWRNVNVYHGASNIKTYPTLSVSNEQIDKHIDDLLKIGGKDLFRNQHDKDPLVPEQYGTYKPTLIELPFDRIADNFDLVTKEIFAPISIITFYSDDDLSEIIKLTDCMEHRLTCAIVSKDLEFINEFMGKTTNGTTYVGKRARTTGAPQNHFFGPSGDPRAAGIGSVESIINTWSCHRTIVRDE